jgi:hypothetical protein
MEHMDALIASLNPEEITYLRGALEALEESPVAEGDDEEIPFNPEDEE